MERFWSKVNITTPDQCWEWQAHIFQNTGYGSFYYQGQVTTAHRIAWILSFGKIPPKTQVCHRCDNRSCVNPDHLFLGNHKINALDALAKGRLHSGPNPKISIAVQGSKNHRSKITDKDVKEIRRLYSSTKKSQNEIAKIFGICRANVSLIVNYKRWRHI